MKKHFTLIIVLFLYQSALYSQIGIGNSSPRGALDINNHDGTHTYPLVLPANNSTSKMKNPSGGEIAQGSMMYDSNEGCIRFYNHIDKKWSDCMVAESQNNIYPSNCNKNGFEGSYVQNEVMTADNKFTLEITNNSFSAVTLSLKPEDLILTGIDTDTGLGFTDTGLKVSAVSPASATINSGDSKLITYTITGIPTKIFTLKGNWKKLALNCSNTVKITKGNADLDFTKAQETIISIASKDNSELNVQGIIDNNANKINIAIPYSQGKGVYSAYTSKPVTVIGEAGDTNNLTLSFPEGNFSSTGTITATVKVGGNGTFNVKNLEIGATELIANLPVQINEEEKGVINITAVGGIPDLNFGDGIHDFVYLPIEGEDGRTWLNHDLGANYTNIHHPNFNPVQRPKSERDFNTYGSLFQWGRLADSHEIIKYDAKGATPLRGSIERQSSTDIPKTNEYIIIISKTSNWRYPANVKLWQGVDGINNPCPKGYRVPTKAEFENYAKVAKVKNSTSAFVSKLGLVPGYARNNNLGELEKYKPSYWTSTNYEQRFSDDSSYLFQFTYSLTELFPNNNNYAAYNIRCIKD